jgi:hypothetical protein
MGKRVEKEEKETESREGREEEAAALLATECRWTGRGNGHGNGLGLGSPNWDFGVLGTRIGGAIKCVVEALALSQSDKFDANEFPSKKKAEESAPK